MAVSGNKTAFFIVGSCILVCLCFLVFNLNSFYIIGYALPAILLLLLLMVFLDARPFYFLMILTLPFSVKYNFPGTEIQMIMPGELFETVLFLAYILRYFTGKQHFDKSFFSHPVTLAVFIYIGFTLLSVLFTSMPVVSVKAVAVKLIYIGVFYFFMHEIIKETIQKAFYPFTLYGLSMLFVIFYSLYNLSAYNFSKDVSGNVSLPFYSDHTIYSACLAFVLPVFLILLFTKEITLASFYSKIYYLFASIILLTGILFSYCRATWVSLIIGLIMFILVKLKVKPVQIFTGVFIVGIYFYLNSDQILSNIKQNHYDSNAKDASFEVQTKSITNISNDQSNKERLNRWKCALCMFNERPWSGFGPGTYQFQYLPFQKAADMTPISVTNPYNTIKGHGGTAHSEYLLVLSESGIFAFLSFLFLISITLVKAIRNGIYTKDKRLKYINIALLIGLTTYLTHSLFNNFLDTDKAAFLFWGGLSILTTLDLTFKKPGIL